MLVGLWTKTLEEEDAKGREVRALEGNRRERQTKAGKNR
jgi:hypothetical protein